MLGGGFLSSHFGWQCWGASGSTEPWHLSHHLLGLRRAVRPGSGGSEGLFMGISGWEGRVGRAPPFTVPRLHLGASPTLGPATRGKPHATPARPSRRQGPAPDLGSPPAGAGRLSLNSEATSEAGSPQGGASDQDVHTELPPPVACGPVPATWAPRVPKPSATPHASCQ